MKRILKIIYISLIFMFLISVQVNAATDTKKVQEMVTKYKNIDINKVSNEEIEQIYNEALESYTSKELSTIVKENKDKLVSKGFSAETVEKGAEFLETTEDEQVREILKGTDIKQVITRVQNGESIEGAIFRSQKNLNNTVVSGVKLVFSSYIVKTILIILAIYILYKVIIRGIIYKKAGKYFISTFIPIYRDAVLFKICGYSPWIVLFLLLPVLGWLIYLVYKIFMKFELAAAFGHNMGFGLGVWLLNPIFESIIAFSDNKYEVN